MPDRMLCGNVDLRAPARVPPHNRVWESDEFTLSDSDRVLPAIPGYEAPASLSISGTVQSRSKKFRAATDIVRARQRIEQGFG
jgi:hypothetical protein